MPAGPAVPLVQLLPAAEDPQPQAAAEGEGGEHAGGASELVSRLTFSGNFGAGGAGFTVPAGLEGGRGEDAEQGGEAEPEDEPPPPPPTGVQRVLRALPAVAGLLGLLVGLWDACSSELSMFIHHGPCVSSAHTMLDTLTESGGFACLSATSVYVLIALADYPPARARSGAAVALAQAAGALVSVLILTGQHFNVTAAWWFGLLVAVPTTAAAGRRLAGQGRLDLGQYPTCFGVVAGIWPMVAVAAASARSAGGFINAVSIVGGGALVAGVPAYVCIELANGLCCCRCCGRRATGAAAALVGAADQEATGQTSPHSNRLGRPLVVLGAALGFLLPFVWFVVFGIAEYGSCPKTSARACRENLLASLPIWLRNTVIYSFPFTIIGAATAQFLVDAYGVDGATDASGWLTYDLALLSFGRRHTPARRQRSAEPGRLMALSCNFVDCHNMACGPLARLPAIRKLFVIAGHFSFWAQAVLYIELYTLLVAAVYVGTNGLFAELDESGGGGGGGHAIVDCGAEYTTTRGDVQMRLGTECVRAQATLGTWNGTAAEFAAPQKPLAEWRAGGSKKIDWVRRRGHRWMRTSAGTA
jgi:hypothetical protein